MNYPSSFLVFAKMLAQRDTHSLQIKVLGPAMMRTRPRGLEQKLQRTRLSDPKASAAGA